MPGDPLGLNQFAGLGGFPGPGPSASPGLFGAGGFLEQSAIASNPLLGLTNMTPLQKILATSGFNFRSGNTSVSLGAQGGQGGRDLAQNLILANLLKGDRSLGVGGATGNTRVLENEAGAELFRSSIDPTAIRFPAIAPIPGSGFGSRGAFPPLQSATQAGSF